jgi:nucleotide-binding universal stress UspA family protein
MALIKNILYPVDFSPSCIAMAPYIKRVARLFGAGVTLVHVVDPGGYNGFELYVRPPFEITEDHRKIGRERLDSYLTEEFPVGEFPRILALGDAATLIAQVARNSDFDLVAMPTHASFFRRMLLGSTTAKVLNDADCPVLTSAHTETIVPGTLDHRKWVCATDLSPDSERVLRYARDAAAEADSKLTIIHAVQAGDPELPIQLDLEEHFHSAERKLASQRIAELQRIVGTEFPVKIAVGSVKEALLAAARASHADALLIGRSPRSGEHDRLRDLTYSMVRDSPYPVLSV